MVSAAIDGRYVLEAEIGRGGMGAVWRARDEVLGRTVAMKRIGLLPGQEYADEARAQREATLAARVQHPHVVAVFDLVHAGDELWLVMEHVVGRSLAAVVSEDGPLEPDAAAGLLAQVADALAASHAAGVVHRDVKPSNILVTPEGQAKLTDFGIARGQADVSLTRTGLLTGSPSYLAPEVVSGRTATPASDMWSLGATLVHAVTGRPPYPQEQGEEAVLATLYRIVHDDPPRPPEAGWRLPLLDASLVHEPERRWSAVAARDFLRGPRHGATAARSAVALPVPPVPPVPAVPPVGPPPARVQAPQPGATAVLPGATPGRPGARWAPPPAPGGRGRPPTWLPLAALAAVVVLGVLAAVLVLGGDEEPGRVAAGPSPSASVSSTPTAAPSPSESASRNPTATPSDVATSEGMADFVRTYLDTVVEDPAAAFGMLTPRFQEASGGIGGYRGFWDKVKAVKLRDLQADPDTMLVDYEYTYRLRSAGKRTETVRLRLEYAHGTYRIADEVR